MITYDTISQNIRLQEKLLDINVHTLCLALIVEYKLIRSANMFKAITSFVCAKDGEKDVYLYLIAPEMLSLIRKLAPVVAAIEDKTIEPNENIKTSFDIIRNPDFQEVLKF